MRRDDGWEERVNEAIIVFGVGFLLTFGLGLVYLNAR